MARREAAYGAALAELVRGLEAIGDLAAEAREIAERAYRGQRAGLKELPAELEEINRRISSSEVKDVAGFLFPPVSELEAALESPRSEPLERHLELSATLYRALGESVDYNLEVIRTFIAKDSPTETRYIE